MSHAAILAITLLWAVLASATPAQACPSVTGQGPAMHGLAMHGAPQLGKGFARYAYAASETVAKEGTMRVARIGTFDSLNPFSVRGTLGKQIRERVFESLLSRNYDEAFALYGQLAVSVTTPDDRSFVRFELDRRAKFSDGTPVSVADVAFSARKLAREGRPNHRYYYGKIARIETSGRAITFHFQTEESGGYDREMPLIMGLMPILPAHIYADTDLQRVSLARPIGSGPYRITEVDTGRKIVFTRNPDYWGTELPSQRGRHNIARIEESYFRDELTAFEAFKSGLIDIWFASHPERWSQLSARSKNGRHIIKEEIPLGLATGLHAIVLNTRRPVLASPPLRRALDLLFDFAWVNRTLYNSAYARTVSYFGRTDMSAFGVTADARERALLKDSGLSEFALTQGYKPPRADGSGRDRRLGRAARQLLTNAGYTYKNGKLHDPLGQPVTLELVVQRRNDERLALAYKRMLDSAGITLNVRYIDATQYQNRLKNFDFDLIIYQYFASLSPGNEQSYYWSRDAADTPGSRNYPGVKNPAMDRAINALTAARSRADFATAARAIDRILMNQAYVVPLYHPPAQWVARWSHIRHSGTHALYGAQTDSWWVAPTPEPQR